MSTQPTLPPYLIQYRPQSARMQTPDLYQLNGRLFMSAAHPMVSLMARNRGLTMLVAGQALANALAQYIRITPEQLAVVFNGLPTDDPSASATNTLSAEEQQAVRDVAEFVLDTAQEILDAIGDALPQRIHTALRQLLLEQSYPEGSPLATLPYSVKVDGDTFELERVEPLFLPRGGVFSMIAGLVFIYGAEVQEVEYTLDLVSLATMAEEQRAAAGNLAKALLDFRNAISDAVTNEFVSEAIGQLLASFAASGLDIRKPGPAAANDDVAAPATTEGPSA